jgi:hypothetical protein
MFVFKLFFYTLRYWRMKKPKGLTLDANPFKKLFDLASLPLFWPLRCGRWSRSRSEIASLHAAFQGVDSRQGSGPMSCGVGTGRRRGAQQGVHLPLVLSVAGLLTGGRRLLGQHGSGNKGQGKGCQRQGDTSVLHLVSPQVVSRSNRAAKK